MKSRGYGLKGRTNYSRFTVAPADRILIAVISAFTAAAASGGIAGALSASYNPIIQVSGFSPMMIVSALFYALLCFTPLIYDAEEVIRWNRLHSKI